jgi:dolichol-phosphate mannosyltransferase
MIYVLLPAYNEEAALRTLVPALHAILKGLSEKHEILVSNDGSRDGTSSLLAQFAKEMTVHEVNHETNLGYGAALRSGYLYVLAQNASFDSIIVSLDSDGTHGPEFVPRLLEKIRAGFDMVTASYTMEGGSCTGIPPQRAFFSKVVNWLFKVVSSVPDARTYTNGFRAYRLEILRKVHHRFGEKLIEEPGFAGGTELFLKAAACGGRAGEVPFDHHYERRGKDSKIRIIPTILGYLKLMARARRGFDSAHRGPRESRAQSRGRFR